MLITNCLGAVGCRNTATTAPSRRWLNGGIVGGRRWPYKCLGLPRGMGILPMRRRSILLLPLRRGVAPHGPLDMIYPRRRLNTASQPNANRLIVAGSGMAAMRKPVYSSSKVAAPDLRMLESI